MNTSRHRGERFFFQDSNEYSKRPLEAESLLISFLSPLSSSLSSFSDFSIVFRMNLLSIFFFPFSFPLFLLFLFPLFFSFYPILDLPFESLFWKILLQIETYSFFPFNWRQLLDFFRSLFHMACIVFFVTVSKAQSWKRGKQSFWVRGSSPFLGVRPSHFYSFHVMSFHWPTHSSFVFFFYSLTLQIITLTASHWHH